MTDPILDAVTKELESKKEEPIVEENKSNKPEPKKEEPIVNKEEPKEDKSDKKDEELKPIELGEKFVSYERFKSSNEKYKQLKAEFEEYKKNKPQQNFESEEDREHAEHLKKLGFATKEEQELQKFELREQQIRQEEQELLDKEVRTLEREFDGSDGLPKFEKDKVLSRGIENQVFDPKSAYLIMNLQNIINHFVAKEVANVRKQPSFAKGGVTKEPDILPKGKLNLNDGSLKKHLEDRINGFLGR